MPVDRTERGVAVLHRVDDDADRHQIEDLVEIAALADHLFVKTPEMLAARGELGLHRDLTEPRVHLTEGLGEIDVAFRRPRRDEVVDLRIALRVQRGKREVFQLLLHLLHAESVRERRIDVEGLLCGAALLLHARRSDRAHVVQAIREFDDQHAHVARHCDEHLAHRRRLLGLARVELESLELRETVHDPRDLGAEPRLDVGDGDLRVLDGVMQQGRHDGHLVKADVGDDLGDRQRMADVELSAHARLVLVGSPCHLVGIRDSRRRALRMTSLVGREQGYELFGDGRLLAPPWQHPRGRAHLVPSMAQVYEPKIGLGRSLSGDASCAVSAGA